MRSSSIKPEQQLLHSSTTDLSHNSMPGSHHQGSSSNDQYRRCDRKNFAEVFEGSARELMVRLKEKLGLPSSYENGTESVTLREGPNHVTLRISTQAAYRSSHTFFEWNEKDTDSLALCLKTSRKLPVVDRQRDLLLQESELLRLFTGDKDRIQSFLRERVEPLEKGETTVRQITIQGETFTTELKKNYTFLTWTLPIEEKSRFGKALQLTDQAIDVVTEDDIILSGRNLSQLYNGDKASLAAFINSKLPEPKTVKGQKISVQVGEKSFMCTSKLYSNCWVWTAKTSDNDLVAKWFGKASDADLRKVIPITTSEIQELFRKNGFPISSDKINAGLKRLGPPKEWSLGRKVEEVEGHTLEFRVLRHPKTKHLVRTVENTPENLYLLKTYFHNSQNVTLIDHKNDMVLLDCAPSEDKKNSFKAFINAELPAPHKVKGKSIPVQVGNHTLVVTSKLNDTSWVWTAKKCDNNLVMEWLDKAPEVRLEEVIIVGVHEIHELFQAKGFPLGIQQISKVMRQLENPRKWPHGKKREEINGEPLEFRLLTHPQTLQQVLTIENTERNLHLLKLYFHSNQRNGALSKLLKKGIPTLIYCGSGSRLQKKMALIEAQETGKHLCIFDTLHSMTIWRDIANKIIVPTANRQFTIVPYEMIGKMTQKDRHALMNSETFSIINVDIFSTSNLSHTFFKDSATKLFLKSSSTWDRTQVLGVLASAYPNDKRFSSVFQFDQTFPPESTSSDEELIALLDSISV